MDPLLRESIQEKENEKLKHESELIEHNSRLHRISVRRNSLRRSSLRRASLKEGDNDETGSQSSNNATSPRSVKSHESLSNLDKNAKMAQDLLQVRLVVCL